jgi:dTDP-4-dehydrorhamnose reductase
MQNPIVIYGKNGQIGSALSALAGKAAIVIASSEADFSDYSNVAAILDKIGPKAVINATAYTNVDKAESDEVAAYKANVLIPKSLTSYCKTKDIPFVHYSTDYVFDGSGVLPHKEYDATNPLNVYGKTKLAGEVTVQEVGGKYLIFRTSWVYDASHKNFLTTMLRLGAEREELSIVSDQIGAPTYAADIAAATLKVINDLDPAIRMRGERLVVDFPSGVYNLCNAGEVSWYGYAEAIFEMVRRKNLPLKVKKINPIASEDYPTPAKRPKNSRLDCTKAKTILKIELPDWRESLEKCMGVG